MRGRTASIQKTYLDFVAFDRGQMLADIIAVDATGSTARAVPDAGSTGANDNSASDYTESLRCLAKSIQCDDGSAVDILCAGRPATGNHRAVSVGADLSDDSVRPVAIRYHAAPWHALFAVGSWPATYVRSVRCRNHRRATAAGRSLQLHTAAACHGVSAAARLDIS